MRRNNIRQKYTNTYDPTKSTYDSTPQEVIMKRVGETMMDLAATELDHKKSNAMSVIGYDLSYIGTLFSKKMHEYNEDEIEIITEVSDSMGLTKDGKIIKK